MTIQLRISLLAFAVTLIGCDHQYAHVESLIDAQRFREAILELSRQGPVSASDRSYDAICHRLDSLLAILDNPKRHRPRTTDSLARATIAFHFAPDYMSGSTESRLLRCELWNSYLHNSPLGSLALQFKHNILMLATTEYDSLKDVIAHGFANSTNPSIQIEGYSYLGFKAHSARHYADAINNYSELLRLTTDTHILAKFNLLIAECEYLSGNIKNATEAANIACHLAADGNGPVCSMKSLWLADFQRAQKHPRDPKRQHVFVHYY